MAKLKIFITGGLGYVGGRIAHQLSKIAEVILVTRKQYSQIKDIVLPTNVSILSNVQSYDNNFAQLLYDADIVIHLAAMNEVDCVKNPLEAVEINVLHGCQLLHHCIEQKIKRFIYFSTAHVYGSPLLGKIHENLITRPVHPYAVTHKAFEDFVTAAHDNQKLDGIVIRE